MPDVNVERLQQLSQQNFSMDWPAGLRAATGLGMDPNGISQFLNGTDINGSFAIFESLLGGGVISGAGGLVMPIPSDLTNARADTPDFITGTGDLHVRVIVTMVDWTPGGAQTLAAKWIESTNNRSWLLRVQSTGVPILNWSTTGTNSLNIPGDPAAPIAVANGTKLGVGVKFDVDNGAAGRTATFETSTNGTDWVDLGSPQTTATITSVFDSTATVSVGGRNDSVQALQGVVHRFEERATINGAVIANPDFSAQAPGTTSFVDAAGNTWTVQGSARIT